MKDLPLIPYRIRIGVTGHRTLANSEQIRRQVRHAMDTLLPQFLSPADRDRLGRHREDGTLAYTALSPLAEGADRAVAYAVLEDGDARLDVVLPFDPAEYMKDFQTEASRREFEKLLGRCRKPVILARNPFGDESRAAAYEAVGQYVVDHCDVLMAVWDGGESRGRGGTAEIVGYAREQLRPIIRVWGDAAEILAPGHGLELCALESIARFNSEKVSPEEEARCHEEVAPHFSHPLAVALAKVPRLSAAREMVERQLIPFYLRASALAARSQRRFYRAGYAIYGFSALSVAAVTAAMLHPPAAPFGYGIELVLLLAIVTLERRSRSRHSHQFWMDNRFLAERLRCGFFLAFCGVDPEPIVILPFMGHAQSASDWTVRVFDEIWNRLPRLTLCTSPECVDMSRYIGEAWVGGQVQYHTNKRKREHDARELLEKIGYVILPATILAAALHLLPMLFGGFEWEDWFADVLTAVALVFPPIAAALAGVHAFREHLRLEKRSTSMIPHLQKLQGKMQSVKDPAALASLLHQVDEVMLQESQDWLTLMRYVEIKGG